MEQQEDIWMLLWSDQDSMKLCQHVLQHGTEQWTLAASTLNRPAVICALKWRGMYLKALPVAAGTTKDYTVWELGVLMMGFKTLMGICRTKKELYTVIASWLPGRSADSVKQALRKHIRDNFTSAFAQLGAGWPSTLTGVLAMWPGLCMESEKYSPTTAQAVATMILKHLQQPQQLVPSKSPAFETDPSRQPAPATHLGPLAARAEGSTETVELPLPESGGMIQESIPQKPRVWGPPPIGPVADTAAPTTQGRILPPPLNDAGWLWQASYPDSAKHAAGTLAQQPTSCRCTWPAVVPGRTAVQPEWCKQNYNDYSGNFSVHSMPDNLLFGPTAAYEQCSSFHAQQAEAEAFLQLQPPDLDSRTASANLTGFCNDVFALPDPQQLEAMQHDNHGLYSTSCADLVLDQQQSQTHTAVAGPDIWHRPELYCATVEPLADNTEADAAALILPSLGSESLLHIEKKGLVGSSNALRQQRQGDGGCSIAEQYNAGTGIMATAAAGSQHDAAAAGQPAGANCGDRDDCLWNVEKLLRPPQDSDFPSAEHAIRRAGLQANSVG